MRRVRRRQLLIRYRRLKATVGPVIPRVGNDQLTLRGLPRQSPLHLRARNLAVFWHTGAEPRPATVTGHMGVLIKQDAHPGFKGLADAIRKHICE